MVYGTIVTHWRIHNQSPQLLYLHQHSQRVPEVSLSCFCHCGHREADTEQRSPWRTSRSTKWRRRLWVLRGVLNLEIPFTEELGRDSQEPWVASAGTADWDMSPDEDIKGRKSHLLRDSRPPFLNKHIKTDTSACSFPPTFFQSCSHCSKHF